MGLKVRSVIYALVTYTGYTSYNYVLTQREIQQRELEHDRLNDNNSDKNKGDGKSDIDRRWDVLNIHGRFENPFKEYRPQTLYEFFIMRLIELSEFGPRGGVPNSVAQRVAELKVVQGEDQSGGVGFGVGVATENVNEDGRVQFWRSLRDVCHKGNNLLSYTWFGQSCGLVHSGGKSFLLDPLFEDRIVHERFGPKRVVPCVVNCDEVVDKIKPDYVLVSHDHPDHLGDDSVCKLAQLEHCQWIVPFGIRGFLEEHGIRGDSIREMQWWERTSIDDEFEIVCLPAMHWSGRKLYDANKSLWCSFMILRKGRSLFYHGGDTGYTDGVFKKIGEMYGPVKLAALPIGQYCPEWHQKPRHISPMESVKMMHEMGVHKLIGVHWGTFVLSSENYLEPGQLLAQEGIKEERLNNIIVPSQGRTFIMNDSKLDFTKDDEVESEEKMYIKYA
jgi:N-acyl-phosphatidylethanolamine-hydrolysing phospholipase D